MYKGYGAVKGLEGDHIREGWGDGCGGYVASFDAQLYEQLCEPNPESEFASAPGSSCVPQYPGGNACVKASVPSFMYFESVIFVCGGPCVSYIKVGLLYCILCKAAFEDHPQILVLILSGARHFHQVVLLLHQLN